MITPSAIARTAHRQAPASSEEPARVQVEIQGLRLISEPNWRGHWAAKAERVRAQRATVWAHLRAKATAGVWAKLGAVKALVVTITRLAPRRLDSDNAVASAKAVRDSIAALLGVDDGSEKIDWRVRQESARGYGVRIEIREDRT